MKHKRIIRYIIPVLVLVMLVMGVFTGCDDTAAPSSGEIAPLAITSNLIPDVPMDMYVYGRQDEPTRVPLEVLPDRDYVDVQSFAVWGVPSEADFALGVELVMSSAQEASDIYDQIDVESDVLEEELWKKKDGETLYLVYGDSPAAKSLQNAISDNKFKKYDNRTTLSALSTMPDEGDTAIAGVVLIEPSDEFLEFVAGNADADSLRTLKTMVEIGKIEIVAAGLYSPDQIDVVEMMEMMNNSGNTASTPMGVMAMMKSGYPGLAVEPIVSAFLKNNKFEVTEMEGFSIYKGDLGSGAAGDISLLVRIEGNSLYVALSGDESYAQKLLSGVKK